MRAMTVEWLVPTVGMWVRQVQHRAGVLVDIVRQSFDQAEINKLAGGMAVRQEKAIRRALRVADEEGEGDFRLIVRRRNVVVMLLTHSCFCDIFFSFSTRQLAVADRMQPGVYRLIRGDLASLGPQFRQLFDLF